MKKYHTDPGQYINELLHLTKKRRYTNERYNIILYAFTLPTTRINYPWIDRSLKLCLEADKTNTYRPRSIYMTTDSIYNTSVYTNTSRTDNVRYVSRDPNTSINKHINTRANRKLKKEAAIKEEQFKPSECINTARIILAPDYALITFAAELINDYESQNIHNPIANRDQSRSADPLTHEQLVAIELAKQAMIVDHAASIPNDDRPQRGSLEELIAYEEKKA